MEMNERRCTYTLIETLSVELCSVKPMPHPLRRLLPWVAFAFAYVAASVSFFGLREDFSAQVINHDYVFELILTLVMSISAAACSVWLCVPDMRGQKWLITLPVVLFGVFALWNLLRVSFEHFHMPNAPWHTCYFIAFAFGIIPAVLIFVLSVRGKTTHPFLLSFMNSLAVGGFGYIGLRLVCNTDEVGHICIFHILPYVIFGLLASLVGRRIYKW